MVQFVKRIKNDKDVDVDSMSMDDAFELRGESDFTGKVKGDLETWLTPLNPRQEYRAEAYLHVTNLLY